MSKKSSQNTQSELGVKALPPEGLCCRWHDERILLSRGGVKRAAAPSAAEWSFYLPDFFLEDREPWWIPEEVDLGAPAGAVFQPSITNRINKSWLVDDPTLFYAQVENLKDLFTQGTLKKGVPVVLARSPWQPSPEDRQALVASVLARARENHLLFPYGWWTRSSGMVGLTPEVLFSVHAGCLRTMALAGTKRSGFRAGELLADPKELMEHRLVIEDLTERLAGLGEVQVGSTHECDLGTLTHLKTELTVELKTQPEFEKLVARLHPTAALGAYPREAGAQWLRVHRSREALRFGAPFGVRSPAGEMMCVVAIRNVQWNQEGSWVASGCGIVPPSDPQREWQELELKRRFVLDGLGL